MTAPATPERLGESCLLWRLTSGDAEADAHRVHTLHRALTADVAAARISVDDVVPAYDSIALHFDPRITEELLLIDHVARAIDTLPRNPQPHPDAACVTLPVTYDGPDLVHVGQHAGLTRADVVERHTAPTYLVAAIGFLPHFPYLLGLDPALTAPRRASPRTRVPAGAVAIGGDQTGVYPQESPGGWNLIGTTDPDRLTALRPGDRVRFHPTDRRP